MFPGFWSWLTGFRGAFCDLKEENHVRTTEQKCPPPRGRRACVVLKDLWNQLSAENQQHALTVLSRIVAAQLIETPIRKEVDDE